MSAGLVRGLGGTIFPSSACTAVNRGPVSMKPLAPTPLLLGLALAVLASGASGQILQPPPQQQQPAPATGQATQPRPPATPPQRQQPAPAPAQGATPTPGAAPTPGGASGQVAPSPNPGQAGAPAQRPAGQAAPGGVQPNTTERGVIERRRNRTYAGCNRGAQRRGLRGGDRRRFITRCRLGYDLPPRR